MFALSFLSLSLSNAQVYHNDNLTHFVDASDPKLSHHNWMNFIRCARNSTEQNLKLTQINGSLYFIVTRDIAVGEELLVWYSEIQYGVYLGLPTGFYESRSPSIEAAAMEPGEAGKEMFASSLVVYDCLCNKIISAVVCVRYCVVGVGV